MLQTLAYILTLCSSSLIRFLFKKMHVQYHCFGNINRFVVFLFVGWRAFWGVWFVLGFVAVLFVWLVFLHGGLFAVFKAGLLLASDQELPLLCWLCPRGVVVRSSSEHTWAMFLQGLQAGHCSPVVSNSPNFWALTQKAWLTVLLAISQQPRRSLLETHIGPRGVCSLHICGQCCCVLVVKAAPSDGETGQQSARFWVWVGGFQGGVWDGVSCSLRVSACSFLVKWRLSVPA